MSPAQFAAARELVIAILLLVSLCALPGRIMPERAGGTARRLHVAC
ncbi:MAG TPA: hypothetical protein VHX39_14515 [Acetobacteraceae bacterium]|nr:hypothetical protein [Acetobacteraceae bacterium]